MKHENKVKVYYVDTDSYGIVWHGAYIKWLEVGRVELSALLGVDFKVLDELQVQLPVVEINCRYKSPAKIMDELLIETTIGEVKKTSLTFEHKITNLNAGKVILNATSTCVTTDLNGKMYRKIPEYILERYNNTLEAAKV